MATLMSSDAAASFRMGPSASAAKASMATVALRAVATQNPPYSDAVRDSLGSEALDATHSCEPCSDAVQDSLGSEALEQSPMAPPQSSTKMGSTRIEATPSLPLQSAK